MLSRLLAIGDDTDPGVFLLLQRQQRGVALSLGERFTGEPPRRPQYPGLSEPSRLRKRAGDRGLEHRCLSEIAREIGADASENRSVRRRHNKAFPGHGLAHVDIDPGGLENDVARDRRDRVAIGVAALAHPAAHEILVEALGGWTG